MLKLKRPPESVKQKNQQNEQIPEKSEAGVLESGQFHSVKVCVRAYVFACEWMRKQEKNRQMQSREKNPIATGQVKRACGLIK